MEIRPVGDELFHTEVRQVGRQTERQSDRQTDRYDKVNGHLERICSQI